MLRMIACVIVACPSVALIVLIIATILAPIVRSVICAGWCRRCRRHGSINPESGTTTNHGCWRGGKRGGGGGCLCFKVVVARCIQASAT